MPRTRRRCPAEYRVEAAYRVIDSDRQIAEVAGELGVGEQLLRSSRWTLTGITAIASGYNSGYALKSDSTV